MTAGGRVLLIGAAGYVGRMLSRRLVEAGASVDGLVRSSASTVAAGVRLHAGGLENAANLEQLVDQCSTIVHVASASTPSVSRSAPTIESDLNLSPALRMLELLQGKPGKHLIYMSSGGAIYGNAGHGPVQEGAPLAPQSYYGAGKVAIEAFLGAFAHANGTRVTVLRPSNVYGPHQPYYQAFGVVRTMLQHVADGTTIEIWGDGSVVRDYIYIDDLVEAFMQVIAAGPTTATYNVGAGTGHDLRELLQLVGEVTDQQLSVNYRQSRAIDVPRIVLDTRAIARDLGWQPGTPLREGLRSTWEWLQAARQT